jgi:glycosyltransferase involved in cell wall biosynthesis
MTGDRQPLVSIVIPTYNHARFLTLALESVRAQSYSNWEALVINNYSEDDTTEVVQRFVDARIQLVNFRNHGVIAASRNEGIRRAKGMYVAFLDSDDKWYPEKLARSIARLEQGCDLVCHGEVWTQNGRADRPMVYGPQARAQYRSLLYRGNCISTSATVMRKSVLDQLGGFAEDPAFITAEDYELWLRIANMTTRLDFLPEMLGEYRIHDGNMSKAVLRNMQAELAVLDKHFAMESGHDIEAQLRRRKRRALAYYGAARGFQASADYPAALDMFWRSFVTAPFILRLYAATGITLWQQISAWVRKKA